MTNEYTVRAPLFVPRDLVQIDFGNDATVRFETPCRTGCPTQNHKSYADCARGLQFAPSGTLYTLRQKAENSELDAYESARRQGVQPDGTTMAKVNRAMEISDSSGVAYGG